ncbi:MAG TPA: glycosyltransferase family 4 protein [Methylomirabilota bacterium]|nr:glycosyltransferase family 4 protein [Methylomirabilota bacterium]
MAELRRRGAEATMLPLYLPLTLDVPDQSANAPVFFGGISVYLEQLAPIFGRAPKFLRDMLASRGLLKLAAGGAAATRPEDLGELTLSMARGEDGRQRQELEDLVSWLATQPKPDVIILSNVMLAGLAKRLGKIAPVLCTLQGEDFFLDSLASPHREQVWEELARRSEDIRLFIAPSEYFANHMQARLRIPGERLRVLWNGIDLEGFSPATMTPAEPTIGYFGRICREKGIVTFVEACVDVAKSGLSPAFRVKIGGSLGKQDEALIRDLQKELDRAGLEGRHELHPNVTREEKIRFLQGCSIFSVPALYGEGFGLYLLEAWACGLPVVQPRHAAFPELIESTQAGLLVEPGSGKALAEGFISLLSNEKRAREMGTNGVRAVHERFTINRMASDFLSILTEEKLIQP